MSKTKINDASATVIVDDTVPIRTCGASTKTGTCCEPCEDGRKRCRWHRGAKGGAPSGERNGRYVDGNHTKEAKAERRAIRNVLAGTGKGNALSSHQPYMELVPNVTSDPGRPVPARVVQMKDTTERKAVPPVGVAERKWRNELKLALATQSDAFVEACLHRLMSACCLPRQIIPTSIGLSASLALIHSLEPENELQAALAVDIACLHAASSNVLSRLASHCTESRTTVAANAATKLERAFHSAIKTFHLLKHGHKQEIHVHRMEMQPGSQAVVGQVIKR